ncbi:hypothetical protein Q73_06250 [Bacillus coahuilensis m2-6]|uniref:sensor domain-containing diguanylate cyclase n=1 Tax=Bacillus coahuilensis TaxID=408580 RepID=UPI0001850EBC|nr:diguanylate cyclase [Bacillus coahuilensis]KUP08344.1 hypothetical protein Q73_06250 [Bacillus coahuilensis m2-6]
MKLIRNIILFFVIFFSLFPFNLQASTQTVEITSKTTKLDLVNNLQFYVDRDSVIKNDSSILKYENQFKDFIHTDAAGDVSNATYWLKTTLKNGEPTPIQFYIEIQKPHLSYISVFSKERDQLVLLDETGYAYPFSDRKIAHRHFVFPLTLAGNEQKDVYFKISTDSFFQAPVILWEPETFLEQQYKNQMVFGIYYGVMIAMIIYNSFLYISLRQKTYLYYILFLTGFTVLQAIWDGFASQWLWSELPWIALRSNSLAIIFTSLFSLLFAKHFLQLDTLSPKLSKVIDHFVVISSIVFIIPFLLNISLSTMLSTLVSAVFLVLNIAILISVRTRSRAAKFYLSAWGLLFTGIALNLLAAFKLLPLTFITLYGPKIGGLVEVFVLSLALADQINMVKEEKRREERKYFIQTLLQKSFNQMSTYTDINLTIDSALDSLMEVTHFENGVFVKQVSDKKWTIISNKAEHSISFDPLKLYKFMDKPYPLKQAPNEMEFNQVVLGLLIIPIQLKSLTGMFMVFTEKEDKLNDQEATVLAESFQHLFVSKMDQIESYESLKRSAMFDHLTNLYNRKFFFEKAEEIYRVSNQLDLPLSLLLIDMDYFKKINDTFGHMKGDEVLMYVSSKLNEAFRDKGIIGRYGGEEFIAILQNADEIESYTFAENLRMTILDHPFQLPEGITIPLSLSIGISTGIKSTKTISQLVQEADESLYYAKNNGRNRVIHKGMN